MLAAIPDLSNPIWNAKIAATLERAAASIARLDARVSASPVASPWQRRASWTGYATALRGQGVEIEEIDIFGRECTIALPARHAIATNLIDRDELPAWQRDLAERGHSFWRDGAVISTVLPDDWNRRPTLLRALELTARHARADSTIRPWLAVPALLRSMKITQSVLPCLTIGDKALRFSPRDTEAIIVRNLRSLADHGEKGLTRLQAIEDDRLRAAVALGEAHRPGKLVKLLTLMQFFPVLSPRLVGRRLDVTISGAGKLLARAADLGLVVEVSGRQAWRAYVVRDLAIAFGFLQRPVGRPSAPPKYVVDLEPVLTAFDREMAELDTMLANLGVDSSA